MRFCAATCAMAESCFEEGLVKALWWGFVVHVFGLTIQDGLSVGALSVWRSSSSRSWRELSWYILLCALLVWLRFVKA